VGSRPVSRPIESHQSWIQRVIEDTLLVTKATTTEDIINAFQLRWKKTLKPSTAKKAKTIFLQDSDAAHISKKEFRENFHSFQMVCNCIFQLFKEVFFPSIASRCFLPSGSYGSDFFLLMFSSSTTGTVSSFSGASYVVDIIHRCCTCGDFQYEDVPCAHAWSFMAESNIAPRDWMPYNLTLEAYRKVYTQHMPPVDISNLHPEEDPEHLCCAPNSKRKKPGRPPIARKVRGGQGPRRQQKCGNCGQVGHNQTKCWELPQSVHTPVPASALAPTPRHILPAGSVAVGPPEDM